MKVNYCNHKILPLVPALSQVHPVHTFLLSFCGSLSPQSGMSSGCRKRSPPDIEGSCEYVEWQSVTASNGWSSSLLWDVTHWSQYLAINCLTVMWWVLCHRLISANFHCSSSVYCLCFGALIPSETLKLVWQNHLFISRLVAFKGTW